MFVFAHQDDEVAAASRILMELRSGAAVSCVFLTDGAAGGVPSQTRDRESTNVLRGLGVERIEFVGSRLPIPDGYLVEHLDAALTALRAVTDRCERVYTLAWEGGHQDHDATHLVSAAFARERGAECFELMLYRASNAVFRVFSPLEREGWQARRIPLRDALRIASLPLRYRSQWRSWVGLYPEVAFKTLVLRRELIRRADPQRVQERPHEGRLFYEIRFKFPWERFSEAAKPFIERHFPATR